MTSSGLIRKLRAAGAGSLCSHGGCLPRRVGGRHSSGGVVVAAVVLAAIGRLHRGGRGGLGLVVHRLARPQRARVGGVVPPAGTLGRDVWRPEAAAAHRGADGGEDVGGVLVRRWKRGRGRDRQELAGDRVEHRVAPRRGKCRQPVSSLVVGLGRREGELAGGPPQPGATFHAELVLRAHLGPADVALHAIEPKGRCRAAAGTRQTVADARPIRPVADGLVARRQPAHGADRLAAGPFGRRHLSAAHRGPRSDDVVTGPRACPTCRAHRPRDRLGRRRLASE